MEYTLSQIFGVIVFVFVFFSMQLKNMNHVLLCQIGCNSFGLLSYVLVGGFSACGIYLLATLQAALYLFIRKYEKMEPKWLQPVITLGYIAFSAVSFRGWVDVFPVLAGILCALGIGQKRPTVYRVIMLLNGAVWTVYDILIGAYAMLATHIFVIVSALIGIVRLDILKQSESASQQKQ